MSRRYPTPSILRGAHGNYAIDGRGDRQSPKRVERRRVERALGHPLSGRQWKKLRKQERREAANA